MSRAKRGRGGGSWDPSGIIDWGRGALPRVLVTLAMLAILSFNTAALYLSIPYIVRDLPDEYGSMASGAVRLPYIPSGGSLVVELPEGGIVAYSPFEVAVEYPEGMTPYGVQQLSFGSMANTYDMALSLDGGTGLWSGKVIVPGLPGEGRWNMSMIGLDGPGGVRMYTVDLGEVTVSANDPDSLDAFPALPADRTVDASIGLRTGGGNANGSASVRYRIDGGELRSVGYGSGAEIPIDGLGPGWHLLTLVLAEGGGASHPFRVRVPDGSTKQAPDVTVQAVFGGRDEAFSQDSTAPVRVLSDDETAISGSFYTVTLEYATDPRGNVSHEAAPYLDTFPAPPQGVKVGDDIYPAMPQEDGRSFKAVVLLDGEKANGSRIKILAGPLSAGSACRTRAFDLVLVDNKGPEIRFGRDPFLPRAEGVGLGGVEVTVSDIDYDLGRKEFKSPPNVTLGGTTVEGVEDRPLGYWTRWTFVLDIGDGSGQVLSIDADASFVYVDNLFVLLPIPPFLFGFETPIAGWAAVAWFLVLAAAITVSIVYLFFQEATGTRAVGSRSTGGLLGPGSPLYLTALSYSAILFFSVVVVIAFNMLDQSTPAPGILSEDTPVHFRMLMLAEASVWEEVVARIGYIGIPLAIIGLLGGRRGKAGGLLGGVGSIGRTEAALIIVSASLFGIAHIGWGPWKVLPTFVSGLLLGYLFVKVGVHASIAVHFLIDYSSFLWEIVPAASSFEWAYALVLLALIGLGMFSLGSVTSKIISLAPGRRGRKISMAAAAVVQCIGASAMAWIIGPSGTTVFVMLLSVPLSYAAWFAMRKAGSPALGRAIVVAASVTTLPFAPLGVAFVMADADGD